MTDQDALQTLTLSSWEVLMNNENNISIGSKVIIDGFALATVVGLCPGGSEKYVYPHFVVNFTGGAENVPVNMRRVRAIPKDLVR